MRSGCLKKYKKKEIVLTKIQYNDTCSFIKHILKKSIIIWTNEAEMQLILLS